MRHNLISLFYLISRFTVRVLPFVFIYDWPEKKIVFGPKIEKKKLNQFLASLWPVKLGSSQLLRLGPSGDGGYLLPRDITNIDACLSPGVDKSSGFEKDVAKLFGCNCYLIDASVDAPEIEN